MLQYRIARLLRIALYAFTGRWNPQIRHNPRHLLLYSTSTASRTSSASIGHSSGDTEELSHHPKPSSWLNLSKIQPRRRPSQLADCYTTPKPSSPRHHASGTDNKSSSRILRLSPDSVISAALWLVSAAVGFFWVKKKHVRTANPKARRWAEEVSFGKCFKT